MPEYLHRVESLSQDVLGIFCHVVWVHSSFQLLNCPLQEQVIQPVDSLPLVQERFADVTQTHLEGFVRLAFDALDNLVIFDLVIKP